MTIYTKENPAAREEKGKLQNILGYYEYPGIVHIKEAREDLKRNLQEEWIITLTDVYQRYLQAKIQFFYVITKVCIILFGNLNNKLKKTPVCIMNTTIRSMKLSFEKYNIQCKIQTEDKKEMPFKSNDLSNMPSSQQMNDDITSGFSSQAYFENQL